MNYTGKDLRDFVSIFEKEKRLVGEITSMLVLISHDQNYGDGFYLFPLPGFSPRRTQLFIKRGAKQRTWSFVHIRGGKTDTDTYRDNLDDGSVLRLVRDTLREGLK